jgi:phosphoribosylformylglycinamidine cyclo-ligase
MANSMNYKAAGVDIVAGNEAVARIKHKVAQTFTPSVLTNIGSFAALYDLKAIAKSYQHPVLVQSIDGVGTKMMVAKMMNHYATIGMDLVSATANDIIVVGAKPLTLLDYIANDRLQVSVIEQIIDGMVKACCDNGIALVGGEMAEMPGTYLPGEHDLVGIITGVVEKHKAILGNDIVVGDKVIALPASGLHTNGYSLARKLCFEVAKLKIDQYLPQLNNTIGDTLLTPHLNYTQVISHLLTNGIAIKGMAHITGGGILGNIPRILPDTCAVSIKTNSWPILPIFNYLQTLSQLTTDEMYRTFNMGIGLIIILSAEQVSLLKMQLASFNSYPYYEVGEVVSGNKEVRLI